MPGAKLCEEVRRQLPLSHWERVPEGRMRAGHGAVPDVVRRRFVRFDNRGVAVSQAHPP